jgi:hypothetical protein
MGDELCVNVRRLEGWGEAKFVVLHAAPLPRRVIGQENVTQIEIRPQVT